MNTPEGRQRAAATRIGVSVEECRAQTRRGFKWCWCCKNWILREQFALDRSRSDGLKSVCFGCSRVKNRKVRAATGTPAEMQGAHDAVRHAIKAGRLARPTTLPCLDCSKRAAHYHHHRGYAREHWLDVVAVCISCHQKRHWLDADEEERDVG